MIEAQNLVLQIDQCISSQESGLHRVCRIDNKLKLAFRSNHKQNLEMEVIQWSSVCTEMHLIRHAHNFRAYFFAVSDSLAEIAIYLPSFMEDALSFRRPVKGSMADTPKSTKQASLPSLVSTTTAHPLSTALHTLLYGQPCRESRHPA